MDKRKKNGGHSTKAKGVDKRKNEYRTALTKAAGTDDLVEVIKMLFKKATTKQDTKAAQLVLEYYLGKPKESIDVHTTGDSHVSFNDLISAIKKGD